MKSNILLVTCVLSLIYTSVFAQAPVVKWTKSYGGTSFDNIKKIRKTMDGGYIIIGDSYSTDVDLRYNMGHSDVFIVKTDSEGNLEWSHSYGGEHIDSGNDIVETNNDGYIAVAQSYSVGGMITNNYGGFDIWIFKIDNLGNLLWQKNVGGSMSDNPTAIISSNDGNFIISGGFGSDCYLQKMDGDGNIIWERVYGGSNYDIFNTVICTSDGGYLLGGLSRSSNGDVTINQGLDDCWLVKVDTDGLLEWQHSYGGENNDEIKGILEDEIGDFVVVSKSNSTSGDISNSIGDYDFWVFKTDALGTMLWDTTLGHISYDYVEGVVFDNEGNIIISGSVNLMPGGHGNTDIALYKLSSDGTQIWAKPIGGSNSDSGCNLIINENREYILGGYSYSSNGDFAGVNIGSSDFSLICLATPFPYIQPQQDTVFVCMNQSTTLSVSATGEEPLTYQWQYEGVDIPGATQETYNTPLFSNLLTGTFTCIVSNFIGSATSTGTILIEQLNPSVASFEYNLHNSNLFFSNSSENANSYFWDFGNGTYDTIAEPNVTFEEIGLYTVCLIAGNGCFSDTICEDILYSCSQGLQDLLPVDTTIPPNQDYNYSMVDTFLTYSWNNGETTAIVHIPNNELIIGNNCAWVQVTYENGCAFSSFFAINLSDCQSFYTRIDSSVFNYLDSSIVYLCLDEPLNTSINVIFASNNTSYSQHEDSTLFFWDDGENAQTSQDITLNYSVPGQYDIQHFAVDQYGCQSSINSFQVIVLPEVEFGDFIAFSDTIHLGDTIRLYANVENANFEVITNTIMYSNFSHINDWDTTELDVSMELFYDGDVIESADDIESICMNIEHSYLGDLTISLTCENNVLTGLPTTVILEDQHGGGAFLGEPIDNEFVTDIGVGWEYCWTNAANADFSEDMGDYATSGSTLPAGSYLSTESFNAFIGCEIGGVWTFSIIDNWQIDDGNLFYWEINFSDSLSATMHSGLCDTSYWIGENIIEIGDTIIAVPLSTGWKEYTYRCETEYGCTNDTTVFVYVDFSIDVNEASQNFKVYPNPFKDIVTLELSDNNAQQYEIEIFSITGQVLARFKCVKEKSLNLDFSEFDPGIYFAKIITLDDEVSVIKMVKGK